MCVEIWIKCQISAVFIAVDVFWDSWSPVCVWWTATQASLYKTPWSRSRPRLRIADWNPGVKCWAAEVGLKKKTSGRFYTVVEAFTGVLVEMLLHVDMMASNSCCTLMMWISVTLCSLLQCQNLLHPFSWLSISAACMWSGAVRSPATASGSPCCLGYLN